MTTTFDRPASWKGWLYASGREMCQALVALPQRVFCVWVAMLLIGAAHSVDPIVPPFSFLTVWVFFVVADLVHAVVKTSS